MKIVDLLLNLAALLLWLGWRAGRTRSRSPAGGPLVALLQAPAPPRSTRWVALAAIPVLLAARAWLYWRVGSEVGWVALLDVGVLSLPFKSVSATRMLWYSGASFAVCLATFYCWLLLFSVLNRGVSDSDRLQRWIRQELGRVDRWPGLVKCVLPVVLAGGLWCGLHGGLVALGLVAPPTSGLHLAGQGWVIGLGCLLGWKYPLAFVLVLHLLSTYLYVGSHPGWAFVNHSARNLLRPLAGLPLRLGRIDLTPLLAIAVIVLLSELAGRGLTAWFAHLT